VENTIVILIYLSIFSLIFKTICLQIGMISQLVFTVVADYKIGAVLMIRGQSRQSDFRFACTFDISRGQHSSANIEACKQEDGYMHLCNLKWESILTVFKETSLPLSSPTHARHIIKY